MHKSELETLRGQVDGIDSEIIELLAKRFEVTAQIGKLKARESLNAVDPDRETNQTKRYQRLAAEKGLNPEVLVNVFRVVIEEVVRKHREA